MQTFNKPLVGINIEFLLYIAALVLGAAGNAENVNQASLVYFPVDNLGSNAYVSEQPGELSCGVLKIFFGADDKLVEGDNSVVGDGWRNDGVVYIGFGRMLWHNCSFWLITALPEPVSFDGIWQFGRFG